MVIKVVKSRLKHVECLHFTSTLELVKVLGTNGILTNRKLSLLLDFIARALTSLNAFLR